MSKPKRFKDYYDSDPEFRARHLNYVKQKVECPCGSSTARCNMSKHLRSLRHQKWEEEQSLQKRVKRLEKLLHSELTSKLSK